MKNNIVILGDWIADVYISNHKIKQNQEIISEKSYKGHYESINVYPGGTGFLIDTFLSLVNNNNLFDIKYLLPAFNFIDYKNDNFYAFNMHELFDRSIKYIYNNRCCDNFSIIKMQPIDYINDVLEPTVKIRFYSKSHKRIFYRFDRDNTKLIKNINCNHLFSTVDNVLLLIDYDKGIFSEDSIVSLYDYIFNNDIKIETVFLNTKPHKLHLFKELFKFLKLNKSCDIIIQLNEFEFEPVKDVIDNLDWTYLIVTRGTKDIHLYTKYIMQGETVFDISDSIINDIPTTSGCGDIFFSQVMFNYLYNSLSIENSIQSAVNNMKNILYSLNDKLFK